MPPKSAPWGLDAPDGPVLHVGCQQEPLPWWLTDREEVRLDIDPGVNPDICASMTNMGEIGMFPVVYCSHALEHLYPYDIPKALSEFQRVLSPSGVVVVLVPDLEGVVPDDKVLFTSPAGPVTGHDLYYGHGPSLGDNPYMAHHAGFVQSTLKRRMEGHFDNVNVARLPHYNLMAVGIGKEI